MGAVDGDYRVKVVLGGPKASVTTVKAESRRLMVLGKTVRAGGAATETFVVNVRVPEIAGGAAGADGMVAKSGASAGAAE